MNLNLQQLEAHLWGAANILRGKTAGQDYKNYILSLMFYKRLCDQWECEADDAIAELERQQGRTFTEKQKAVFRKRGEHRFKIPDGSRWGDVKAVSTHIGDTLTRQCVQWPMPTTNCVASLQWIGASPHQMVRVNL
jgi:type I restriction enzyme M protein